MARIPDTPENVIKCICGGYPFYDDCMRSSEEILWRENIRCRFSC